MQNRVGSSLQLTSSIVYKSGWGLSNQNQQIGRGNRPQKYENIRIRNWFFTS